MVASERCPRNKVEPRVKMHRSDETNISVGSRESVGESIGRSKRMAKNPQSLLANPAVAFQSLVTHLPPEKPARFRGSCRRSICRGRRGRESEAKLADTTRQQARLRACSCLRPNRRADLINPESAGFSGGRHIMERDIDNTNV